MLKKLLFLLLFVSFVFGVKQDFKQPSEAFKITKSEDDNKVTIKIELENDIYLYDEFLEIFNGDENITKKISFKKPVKYHDFIVHFDKVVLKIPKKLITNTLTLKYQGCSTAGICYSPMEKEFNFSFIKNQIKDEKVSKTKTSTITQTLKTKSIFIVLLTFFGFGLLLALTPCIFPMIPILSSIIVQQGAINKGKMSALRGFLLSLVYVLSMSLAYTFAGILAGLFGANIQATLQNPYVIISFVLVFVALAFSMFGYFELAFPSSWQTKLNKLSGNSSKNGGLLGVGIMGFLSALIVGPCVAPPLAGALIYIGQTGDALVGGLALFVMSLGMGVPLLLIGIGAGKFMPKPGGWMDTVSKIFGVVMLGIAIWMLDKIVPEITTVILFVILILGSAFYLLRSDKKISKIIAIILVVLSFIFTYSYFKSTKQDKIHFLYVKNLTQLNDVVSNAKKPVLIDFWATWCVSCTEFDKITFVDKEVKKELSKYLLVKVDVTKNSDNDKALLKRFNLFGPPAMIIFENGKEIKHKRVIGFLEPKEFLEAINKK
jgi:thiol:disulfide interchange protein DsbD